MSSYLDNYEINDLLGSGAYAQVYKCTRKSDQQNFAIKILKTLDKHNNSTFRTFDNELSINNKLNKTINKEENNKNVSRVSHDNIVNLHDYYQKPTYCLIFDLCKGGDLFDDIEKREHYYERDAAVAMQQILSGVAYINKNKIIHCDLKPENLLLTETGLVKIADFGMAVDVSHYPNEEIKGQRGTEIYMAPEVFNKSFSYKADAWSCGVIMYILFAGFFPFNDIDDDHMKAKFDFNDVVFSDMSNAAKKLIGKLIVRKPKKRLLCSEALKDKWFNILKLSDNNGKDNNGKDDNNSLNISNPSLSSAQLKIKEFNTNRRFKRAALTVMAAKRFTGTNSCINEASPERKVLSSDVSTLRGQEREPGFSEPPSPTGCISWLSMLFGRR